MVDYGDQDFLHVIIVLMRDTSGTESISFPTWQLGGEPMQTVGLVIVFWVTANVLIGAVWISCSLLIKAQKPPNRDSHSHLPKNVGLPYKHGT